MPKTLYLARSFPPDIGGAESLSLVRCKVFLPPSDVIVVAPDSEGAQEADKALPFTTHRWPYSRKWPLLLRYAALIILPLWKTLRLSANPQIGTIECSQPLPIGLAAVIGKVIFRKKTVVWALGNDVFGPKRSFIGRLGLRLVFHSADKIVAISRYTSDGVAQLFSDPEKMRRKTVIIHPPVDLSRYTPDVDGTVLRTRYGLENKLVILTVARLVRRKGVDNLLRSLPEVFERFDNVVYVVAGSGPDLARYQQLAYELGIKKRVFFIGKVSDEELPMCYAMADIFALLSQSWPEKGDVEGYGIVLREAGACGKSVVGSDEGGIPDVVVNGENGYLVNPRDYHAIAEALCRLLENPDLRSRFGQRGLEMARQTTNWQDALPT